MRSIASRVGNRLTRAARAAAHVYAQSRPSPDRNWFVESLSYFARKRGATTAKGVLLVQIVEDYEFAVKLAAASKALAEKFDLRVDLYDVRINWSWKAAVVDAIQTRIIGNLHRMYLAFGDRVAFRCTDRFHDQRLIETQLKAIVAQLEGSAPSAILDIRFDGILVGDLIYDSYLRYYHKPTVTAVDGDVIRTIEVALNVFHVASEYLRANDVKALLNTYTSYIHHGIPARLCLRQGIDVYTMASDVYVIQRARTDFPYHQIDHTIFRADLPLTDQQRTLAKERLESRVTGVIDPAIHYMRQSSFFTSETSAELRALFALKSRNVVIYTHDFYDSPHVHRELQFPDLYEFLKQTLEALVDLRSTSVFVKLHPNGMEGSKEQAIALVERYQCPHFHVLDESVSNANIVELRPDLVCTARGTVGIEMAYVGIPTVALYDNPYVNFRFVDSCRDLGTYFAILRGEQQPQIDFDREPLYRFYYQAYLEKSISNPDDIFAQLRKLRSDVFNDECLAYLRSINYEGRRGEIVERYRTALNADELTRTCSPAA